MKQIIQKYGQKIMLMTILEFGKKHTIRSMKKFGPRLILRTG